MFNYIKIMLITSLYTLGGAALITIFTAPTDPKEPNLLGQVLALIWCGMVYFTYTFPAIDDFRQSLKEKTKDTEDDEN